MTGRYGDMLGVWIEPVRAAVITALRILGFLSNYFTSTRLI